MKILYLTQYFPPEVGATQKRAYEMAKNLCALGHEVTVMTELPNHPSGIIRDEYKGKFKVRECIDGIDIIRSWIYTSPVKNLRTRVLFYLSFAISTIINFFTVDDKRFDVVYATSPPLFVGLAGLTIAKLRRIPFVFEVRDLWPDSAIELGEIKNKMLISVSRALERTFYKRAERIVAVTKGIHEALRLRGVSERKISLIKNGTNPDTYRFVYDKQLLKNLGWEGKFVVLYAGLMGIAQGLETIVRAAELLREVDKIRFVFIGEGPAKGEIRMLLEKRGLRNVELHEEVPPSDIARYISLASVCLVPLRKKRVFRGALPSKIFDYWACERPVILSVDGEAREKVERARGGVFVEPENAEALAQTIMDLYKRPHLGEKLGKNGKEYIMSAGYLCSLQAQRLCKLLLDVVEGNAVEN